jgi:hypothetical protein
MFSLLQMPCATSDIIFNMLTMVSVWYSKKQGTACSVFYNPSYTYLLHSTVQSCKYVHFVNIPVIFMDM